MKVSINNNITISKLGLGTVKFGRNTNVKYPKKFNIPTDYEIKNLLENAYSIGINTIDTAPAYGNSEERIGKLLPSPRENWTIISKAGEIYKENKSTYNFDAKFINQSLDKSLKNLNTNYLDIFLIHSDGNDEAIANNELLWKILEKRKSQGDIKSFGVSIKSLKGGLACLKVSDIAMIALNANENQNDILKILKFASINNKNILLKKVFNSGNFIESKEESLRKAFQHEAVVSAIIGSINIDHLKENQEVIKSIFTRF